MNKLQRFLIIALGLQLALGVFVFWPRPVASSTGQPLMAGFKASDVTGMTITDDKGVTTKLVKQGDSWVAPDAGNYPADGTKITPVLDKLTAIKTGKPVATTVASQAQLQVAEGKFARKIELTKADNTTQTVFLGSPAGQSVHVRLGGKNDVFIAGGLSTYEVSADLLSWIDPVYLSLNANDLTALTLTNKNGSFALTKDAQGQWQLAGVSGAETLDQGKATSLATSATSLRMTKPLGKTEDPAWGLKQPSAVLTMQVKTSNAGTPGPTKTVTLTVGSQDPTDKSYVVKSSESEYYVRVAEYSVQDFVSRDKAGFLTATPTPAAAAPAGPAIGGTPTP
jgi:hypothetical protein